MSSSYEVTFDAGSDIALHNVYQRKADDLHDRWNVDTFEEFIVMLALHGLGEIDTLGIR